MVPNPRRESEVPTSRSESEVPVVPNPRRESTNPISRRESEELNHTSNPNDQVILEEDASQVVNNRAPDSNKNDQDIQEIDSGFESISGTDETYASCRWSIRLSQGFYDRGHDIYKI